MNGVQIGNDYGTTEATNPALCASALDPERSTSIDDVDSTEHHGPSIFNQFWDKLFTEWLNLFVLFAPAGIAAHYAGVNPIIVFVLNSVAIIRLAALLAFGTENVAHHCGDAVGALLNATFGNAVELIVAVLALLKREIVIVQTSLIGSILSNLLLVMGVSFIAGGYDRPEQRFNITMANTSSSLILFAVMSQLILVLFDGRLPSKANDSSTTQISRGTAIIMVLIYAASIFFQLGSHKDLYAVPSPKTPTRRDRTESTSLLDDPSAHVVVEVAADDSPPETEEPELSFWAAIILLVLSTAVIGWSAECLVSSLDYLVTSTGISRVFVGLILLPIVGNAAEHATAVMCAMKDKMDITIGVAAGSAAQIAMFLIPCLVLVGWCLGIDEMTLAFDFLQLAFVFCAVILAHILLMDGISYYLEGILLVGFYCIISLVAWFS